MAKVFDSGLRHVIARFGVALAALVLVLVGSASASVGGQPQVRAWQAGGRVSAIAVVGTTAYLGGSFGRMISPDGTRRVRRAHLAAIDTATGALLPWHPTTNGAVLALRIDGARLLVGGAFTSVAGKQRNHIASLSRSTGGLTPGWNASANSSVAAIAVYRQSVFLGGAFTRVNQRARGHVAAVSGRSGALITGWHPAVNAAVHALAVDAAKREIYVGGDFTAVNGHPASYLQPFNVTTGAVRAWRSHPVARVWSIAFGDGRVFVGLGGTGGQLDAYHQSTGARLWQRWADGDVQSVAYSKGTVFAGGHFANACRTSAGGGAPWVCAQPIVRTRLMSLAASTGALLPWKPIADSKWGVFAIRTTPSRVLVGGDFKHLAGIHRWHYAQFTR